MWCTCAKLCQVLSFMSLSVFQLTGKPKTVINGLDKQELYMKDCNIYCFCVHDCWMKLFMGLRLRAFCFPRMWNILSRRTLTAMDWDIQLYYMIKKGTVQHSSNDEGFVHSIGQQLRKNMLPVCRRCSLQNGRNTVKNCAALMCTNYTSESVWNQALIQTRHQDWANIWNTRTPLNHRAFM